MKKAFALLGLLSAAMFSAQSNSPSQVQMMADAKKHFNGYVPGVPSGIKPTTGKRPNQKKRRKLARINPSMRHRLGLKTK